MRFQFISAHGSSCNNCDKAFPQIVDLECYEILIPGRTLFVMHELTQIISPKMYPTTPQREISNVNLHTYIKILNVLVQRL